MHTRLVIGSWHSYGVILADQRSRLKTRFADGADRRRGVLRPKAARLARVAGDQAEAAGSRSAPLPATRLGDSSLLSR